jgi:AraC-like DNA-binding protein
MTNATTGAYAERLSRVPGAVLWTSRPRSVTAVVPDGCMDVLWFDGRLMVAGPDTVPKFGGPPRQTGEDRVIGLRFAPGTGPAVLGVPAGTLRDERVWLDDLWGREAAAWESAFLAGGRRGEVLEALVGSRFEDARPDPVLGRVVALCSDGARVDQVAREVAWSERTLRRRCEAAFGYGPKVLTRILRFQRAASLVRSGLGLSDAAVACGYADQSHLSRETRAMTGRPPSAMSPATD